ncbi:MAG TPA: hypothetical protein VHI76_05360 [Solirubrobacterales bacterium]|jgi:hypothetical protein|nr:hypothetical protein [Solirubrobacterales bacterium]
MSARARRVACVALAFAPALSGCGERDEPEPTALPLDEFATRSRTP